MAVGAEVASFALSDRRQLSLPRPNGLGAGAKPDQIALGRGPKDPAGAITRMQTCLTPSRHASVSASTLVGEAEGQEQGGSSALNRRLLRLAGILPARHECLAVQLVGEKPGQRPLLNAWGDVRGIINCKNYNVCDGEPVAERLLRSARAFPVRLKGGFGLQRPFDHTNDGIGLVGPWEPVCTKFPRIFTQALASSSKSLAL